MDRGTVSTPRGGFVPTWTVADRMRKARESAGFDQHGMAAALGIGRTTVSNYERGTTPPKRPILLAWAMATGCDLGWLLDGNHPVTDESAPGGVVRHQGLEPRTRWLTVVAS